MQQEELIWVSKEFAEKYKKIESNEEKIKAFDEYLKTVSEASRKEFRANFEGLEEDVAIYNGLMMQVKRSFEKAKSEQLDASYDLWEQFEKELPSTQKKIESLLDVLGPLASKLDEVNSKLSSIRTYDIERLNETLSKFEQLSEKGERIFKFVVDNFSEGEKP